MQPRPIAGAGRLPAAGRSPQALCVKRVVGLPGERITLSDGDVYADGEILRKDWDVLSAMAIVVDAADYQPHSDAAAPRWRPDREDSRWRAMAEGFEIDEVAPSADPGEPIDWLSYHHEQIWRQGDRVVRRDGPILDDLAYNQNESRELVAVPDVILFCRLESAGEGEVCLRASDGRKEFVVRLDLAGRHGEVREGLRVAARFDLPGSMSLEQPRAVGLGTGRLPAAIGRLGRADRRLSLRSCRLCRAPADSRTVGDRGGRHAAARHRVGGVAGYLLFAPAWKTGDGRVGSSDRTNTGCWGTTPRFPTTAGPGRRMSG